MKWMPLLLAGASVTLAFAALPRAANRRRPAERLRMVESSPLCDAARRPGMVELAGSLAHELNQPLTAITSNAQAAREYLVSGAAAQDEIREILDDIVADASRASDIVQGVRALIRGEAPRLVPFSIGDVVDRALELVRDRARAGGVTLLGATDPALPRAVADPMEIQLVLLNLLVNALDAVQGLRPDAARQVTVSAAARDGLLLLAVRDNGCGVSEGDLDKIFRPFYSSKPRGMGLGLSFSRALMERNGGRVRAIRNRDVGMTFECLLRTEAADTVTAHDALAATMVSRLRAATSRR
ncbi:sensor histidine kinase [Cupriavidus agavae]|uniref:histidine kinase n=1 Tax=Cupriavidus agavae TaxID=1001822 RepID=A0A4Q7RT87_9BURK|nr:ATP-binding protein [Cupriavidus agavae]RZT36804.1 phospho-acceptor domain-containing protein [Cupriavidus agavae]